MAGKNYYDVTEWPVGNPYEDIGEVINSIIEDIKKRQKESDVGNGGKPGAVIYIPSGDYHLATQVVVDISYLKIMGSGHGFTSSSIRFNVPRERMAVSSRIVAGRQPDHGRSAAFRRRRGIGCGILCKAGRKSENKHGRI